MDDVKAEAAAPAAETADWRAELAPEYRKVAEKFLSPAEVVRSYSELERRLGSRPGRVEDYAVKLPDGLPEEIAADAGSAERQARFLAAAHGAGLTNAQAQAAIDFYYGELAEAHGAHSRGRAADDQAREAELRREWGRDYDANLEYGRRAMAKFGDVTSVDRLEQALGSTGVLRMMARIGRAMGEARPFVPTSDAGRQGLTQELDKLMKSKDYWTNPTTQRRVREIHVALYGIDTDDEAQGRRI